MVIIGRFVRKSALVYFRGGSIEVDLNGPLSGNKISDVLGWGATFRLHLTNRKSPSRYLVGSQTLVSWLKCEACFKNATRRLLAHTDTRVNPNDFFKANLNRQIAIGVLGRGDPLKDFLEYSETLSGGAMTDNIQELRGLTSRRPMGRKRSSTNGRILRLLIYGVWNARIPN